MNFKARVQRTIVQELIIDVTANSHDEAKQVAKDILSDDLDDLPPGYAWKEVGNVYKVLEVHKGGRK